MLLESSIETSLTQRCMYGVHAALMAARSLSWWPRWRSDRMSLPRFLASVKAPAVLLSHLRESGTPHSSPPRWVFQGETDPA